MIALLLFVTVVGFVLTRPSGILAGLCVLALASVALLYGCAP